MIVKEEKISRVPLCPVHLIGMGLADLKLVWPFANEVETTGVSKCPQPGCVYTFSRTDGYFKFCAGGNINSEKSLWSVCPEHRGPLYMSEYEGESDIATWRCPQTGCKTDEKRRNNRVAIETAYFLGAGASKAFYPELPLASELTLEYLLNPRGLHALSGPIERVEEYIASQPFPREKRLLTFEQIYPEFPVDLKPFCPGGNLEICLFQKLKFEPGSPPTIFGTWLNENLISGYPVITTNYDTVIEWGVENTYMINPSGARVPGLVDYGVRDDACLPLPSEGGTIPRRTQGHRKLLLLKLYGSVSWSRCRKCSKYVLEIINEDVAVDAHMGRGECDCGGTRHNAVFVPLVGHKSPNDDALSTIWAKAEQVLSQSLHIVFAGFSLHPGDGNILELLRRACSAGQTRRVTVVLGHSDPGILERYRQVYGDRVESYDSGWRKYLEELVKSRRWQRRT
jgi:hypothetical protein